MNYYFGQFFLFLLFIAFVVSLKYRTRFWIIFLTTIQKCWFPITTTLIAVCLFAGMAQGRDIINELDFFKSGWRKYTTIIALWIWAYNSYKLSATSLGLMDPVKVFGNRELASKRIRSLVPAFIGYLPWFVSFWVLLKVREVPDYRILALLLVGFWFFFFYLLFRRNKPYSIGGLVCSIRTINYFTLFVFYFYKKMFDYFNDAIDKILGRPSNLYNKEAHVKANVKAHWKANMNAEQILNWSAHGLMFFLIAVWPIFFAKYIGTIGLVFIALSFFNVLGTLFGYITARSGFPTIAIVIIAAVIFTSVSDNNKSGEIETAIHDRRESLDDNFEKWIMGRAETEDTINVTLVASEGGGLRSAYWTYAVLRKLQLENAGFYKQLYAISGVSGGSLGSVLFCAKQNNGLSDELMKTAIINEDNLSPMIAALFYREIVQTVIPVDIQCLDRSIVMNQTFVKHWKDKHPDNNLLTDNYLELWKQKYRIPALFINSIHVESGNSVVFSNLKFDSTQVQSIDMMRMMKSDLSLCQVVGLSARFPYVQPAAKFEYASGKTWGHLADGGYYENSGVATIYQVYLKLRKQVETLVWKGTKPVIKFSVLFISNGEQSKEHQPGLFLSEINAPINTLMNSWNSKGYSYSHIAKLTINKVDSNDDFFEIRLNRKNNSLPLGWFLSSSSRQEIVRQSENLDSDKEYMRYKKFAL